MAAELNFFVQGIKSEKEFADPIRAEVSVQVQARRRPLAGVYLRSVMWTSVYTL